MLAAARAGGPPQPPSSGPAAYDSWLFGLYDETLTDLDRTCADADSDALKLFRGLDDDLWAILLSRQYTLYPNIRALMPAAPDPNLQVRWNGATGLELLNQSRSFYLKARQQIEKNGPVALSSANVLDFGCGWGRLTRFFARDVDPGALFGCDPVDEILDICRETRVPATLARSEFLPENLPFRERFDVVFSFSVFTHISESAARTCLEAIHGGMNPGGLLLLTIRPPAYLTFCDAMHQIRDSLGADHLARMAEPHYLFVPHAADPNHPQFDGTEMTYGESVITIPFVKEKWSDLFELVEVGMSNSDLYQVVLTLRRKD
jgi:SAM-dependent methyltransferase